MADAKLYAGRVVDDLPLMDHYLRHVNAMTAEALWAKSDIAAELAWRDGEIERLTAERDAALARDAATIELLKEIGPVLSECRWFLCDMHIWHIDTTIAASIDLLPKVDAVIVKAHAALGHPVSTTAAIDAIAQHQEKPDGN